MCLCKWHNLIYFYDWVIFHCIYVPQLLYFISSSVGYLVCFPVLAIVDSAAMHNGVPVSLWILFFSQCMPRSGISGSCGSPIFSFLRNPYCSLWCLHQFTFPPTVQEDSLFCTPSPVFIVCHFLVTAMLTSVRWYLIVISICVSLIISDVEHLFMCLLATFMSSLEKCLFSTHFWLGCLCFWYWATWAICIFWRLILCQLLHFQIFSPILRLVLSFCLWCPLLCQSLL